MLRQEDCRGQPGIQGKFQAICKKYIKQTNAGETFLMAMPPDALALGTRSSNIHSSTGRALRSLC